MHTRLFSICAAFSLAVIGCGDDSSGSGGSDSSTTGAVTTGAASNGSSASSTASVAESSSASSGGGDGGAGEGGGDPGLNGCAEADYVDGTDDGFDRTVLIGADGLVFTPKCLKIAAGQSVIFDGSLATHPLAPGNAENPDAGSPDSPIEPTAAGNTVEFTFDEAGVFPFYCQAHGFGDGQGMSGAIEVE